MEVPGEEFNLRTLPIKHHVCKSCFPQGTKGPSLAEASAEASVSDSGSSSSDSSNESEAA